VLPTAVCCGQVVVLTQRSKLEMEGIFWRCLPAAKRYGTRLIFRQGSPLVPSGATACLRGEDLVQLLCCCVRGGGSYY
jgi:hypothetical protein